MQKRKSWKLNLLTIQSKKKGHIMVWTNLHVALMAKKSMQCNLNPNGMNIIRQKNIYAIQLTNQLFIVSKFMAASFHRTNKLFVCVWLSYGNHIPTSLYPKLRGLNTIFEINSCHQNNVNIIFLESYDGNSAKKI